MSQADPPPVYSPPPLERPAKPGSVTAIGIISIVLGIFGVVGCGGMGMLGLFLVDNGTVEIELGLWDKVVPVINLIAYGMLVVSGVGTLRLAPWARPLAMLFAVIVIVTAVGNLFLATTPPATNDAERAGMAFGKFIGVAMACTYPVVLLVYFNRADARELFTGEPTDPRSAL